MPSSPCGSNELKFGKWGFYHQPNNLWGWWVQFEKKSVFEQFSLTTLHKNYILMFRGLGEERERFKKKKEKKKEKNNKTKKKISLGQKWVGRYERVCLDI